MDHWTASTLVALIGVVGPQWIDIVSIIWIAQLVILYFYHKHHKKPNHLFLVAKILLQKLGISILQILELI